ncbi:MAG: DUF3800 domain-containing protein [Armatimonadetes bacterium]|nr:DUF3800 domain-containing protein [Armatimonadota bacterium]
MARVYIFGDESGNLDFRNGQGASKYFIVSTVTLHDCAVGNDLTELKRRLHWEGYPVNDYFHAVADKQVVRDKVFELLCQHEFRVDATLLDKPKTVPHLASDEIRFYKQAWYLHLKYLVPRVVASDDEVFLIAASFGTKAKKTAAHNALRDVIAHVAPSRTFEVAFWPASTDPCLQVADYCCWAIQRKWESKDARSHVLIADKVKTEFDAFAISNQQYY